MLIHPGIVIKVVRTVNLVTRSFTVMAKNITPVSTDTHKDQLTDMTKSIIPALSHDMYKGQCGRLGVIGGCKEYTGAPYFAAISLLKLGADLSHVFCAEAAAPVIKSYSPELIVHPILDSTTAVEEMSEWLPRLHSLVIGPGLGRDPKLLDNVQGALIKAKELSLPLVIDADGVFLLSRDPSLIQNYTRAILTPNAVEFNRLYQTVMGKQPDPDDLNASVAALGAALGHVTIVRKGRQDIISDGINLLVCSQEGSPRRCGGQGDLLSGSMGAFTFWAHKAKNQNELLSQFGPCLAAAYSACQLTRECARLAFKDHRRSTMTTHMIERIQPAFEGLYGPPRVANL